MSRTTSITYEQALADDQSPGHIYLNADIINGGTTTLANDTYGSDPQIQFNETRDVPIIKDASLYNFSMVRFTMNGAGKDLPLFIPQIELGLANNPASNVNLTIYTVSLVGTITYLGQTRTVYSATTPIIYESETQDIAVAPVPLPPQYPLGTVWSPLTQYAPNTIVQLGSYNYSATALQPNQNNSPPPTATSTAYWKYLPPTGIQVQDLSTRYYWVYTYSHWLRLVNRAWQTAFNSLKLVFAQLYVAPVGTPITINGRIYAQGGYGGTNPVPGLAGGAPQVYYNPTTNLFTTYYPQSVFGNDFITGNSISTDPNTHLNAYCNTSYFGLFTNFVNTFVNLPDGLTNNLLVYSYLGANTYTPTGSIIAYWAMTQDYPSTSSLWSPVGSIVFTTSFLPIINEQTTAVIPAGTANINQTSVPSAFQPIITDIALPVESAQDYRQFINYTPTAEYRMVAFAHGKNEIRQVDVRVFWKYRLTGQLFPLQMFSGSSVSLKLMFRRKDWNQG